MEFAAGFGYVVAISSLSRTHSLYTSLPNPSISNMLGEFLRNAVRGMKAPTEVYPLLAVVTAASIGGTYMGFRKLVTDPHLRRNMTPRRAH
ncbi:hypothetical protein BGW42_004025 [Actinomortierella wolfii]|nr:hypothetical protein BGW42_004025 [Actinomortierella wolfii]